MKNIVFSADDTAVLLGSPDKISKAASLFHKKE